MFVRSSGLQQCHMNKIRVYIIQVEKKEEVTKTKQMMLNAEQDDTQKPIDKMKSFLEKEEQVRDKP